jgi:hypothetical protein
LVREQRIAGQSQLGVFRAANLVNLVNIFMFENITFAIECQSMPFSAISQQETKEFALRVTV